MNVDINPADFDQRYLDGLNVAFDGWGDESLYDWVFRRTAGSRRADQIVLRTDGELLAGSGVSYRRIRGPGEEFGVGIMTGSWTLPAARGKGCFARIIEESRVLSGERGCEYLIAFVTHDNASRRRLEAAGSLMIPSRYIFTSEDEVSSTLEVDEASIDHQSLWQRIEADRDGNWHFAYPDVGDFVGQCIDRPNPTRCLVAGTATVVIEETATADRVVVASYGGEAPGDVLAAVAHRAHESDRRFFAFAMGDLEVPGLTSKEGFLTILSTGADLEAQDAYPRKWRIDAGDRM